VDWRKSLLENSPVDCPPTKDPATNQSEEIPRPPTKDQGPGRVGHGQ
jgi:hypothetical protein